VKFENFFIYREVPIKSRTSFTNRTFQIMEENILYPFCYEVITYLKRRHFLDMVFWLIDPNIPIIKNILNIKKKIKMKIWGTSRYTMFTHHICEKQIMDCGKEERKSCEKLRRST
jgi:hypothetical protein